MNTWFDNKFGDVIKTHRVVDCRSTEFSSINNAAFQSKINFSARKWGDAGTKIGHDVHVPARSSYTHAFEVFHLGGFLIGEKAEFLTDVAAGQCEQVIATVKFLHHLQATTLVQPNVVGDRVGITIISNVAEAGREAK